MTRRDAREFRQFVEAATTSQLYNIIEKERNRRAYRDIAEDELRRRNMLPPYSHP